MKLCSKCREREALGYHAYCRQCHRIYRGMTPERIRNESPDGVLCAKCKLRPRLSYHNWCRECKNASTVKWLKIHKDYESTQIKTARRYAYTLLQRGKIKRGPCVFCGEQGTEFHHYDYKPKTRNFDDVCTSCHKAVHIILKLLLTGTQLVA